MVWTAGMLALFTIRSARPTSTWMRSRLKGWRNLLRLRAWFNAIREIAMAALDTAARCPCCASRYRRANQTRRIPY